MLCACDNSDCRVLIFRPTVPMQCPLCWHIGRSLDEATIDELLSALDKRVNPEQLRMEVAP